MKIEKIIFTIFFGLLGLNASSQYIDPADSIAANNLIATELRSLEKAGGNNFVYMFSELGSVAILYEMHGKIEGLKSYFKGKNTSKSKHLKLTEEDKINYQKSIGLAVKDTTISVAGCKNYVHAFIRFYFAAKKDDHFLQVNFTSDCEDTLRQGEMVSLLSMYYRFVKDF